jgi:signal transduction histidine kinase
MDRFFRSNISRYALSIGLFAIVLGISLLLLQFSIRVNLTILVMGAIAITAWYGGVGPGLLHTILIVAATIILTPIPPDTSTARVVFSYFSVAVFLIFFTLLISNRRKVEDRLREQSRLLQITLEREQAAREEAETASRLKDDFLATVSHELRSPLSAILGWATMLNKTRLEEETARKALATIERNARAQAGIVNDILDVSRIINGNLQINTRSVEIQALISEAVETLRPAALAKSIALTVALDEIEGSVIGDSNRLRQIVWNLVSNAIKFTPENGQVEVSLRQVGSQVEIRVSDNGAGIDEKFLPFVFERFRQGDSSTTRAQGGLGLGLSIVRHLIELHGGTVTAESAGIGQGATFTVRLPLAEKVADTSAIADKITENGSSKEISTNAPDIRGLRILIVDDDTDTLEVLRVVLKQFGARVRIAVSSADALEVFNEWKPDVLISDLAMPVEDGYTLIGKIRALSPEQGGNVPADRRKALSAGYQIHIAKPVDPTTITAAIAEIKKRF